MAEETLQFLKNSIKEYAHYRNTGEHKENEGYKWIFIGEHKGIFDNLDNLQKKIESLGSQNFFPWVSQQSIYRVLSKNNSEKFAEALENLYDESKSLDLRIINFIESLNKLLEEDPEWKNKDFKMDVDSASFFLFLKDSKKYLLFTKKNEFKIFAKKFFIYEKYPLVLETSDKVARYIEWTNYCNNELIPLMDKEFGRKTDMLDAQDLIYCVERYFSDNIKALDPKERKLEIKNKEGKSKMQNLLGILGKNE